MDNGTLGVLETFNIAEAWVAKAITVLLFVTAPLMGAEGWVRHLPLLWLIVPIVDLATRKRREVPYNLAHRRGAS